MNSFFSALWDGLSPVLSVIGSAEFLYSVLHYMKRQIIKKAL